MKPNDIQERISNHKYIERDSSVPDLAAQLRKAKMQLRIEESARRDAEQQRDELRSACRKAWNDLSEGAPITHTKRNRIITNLMAAIVKSEAQ